MSPLVKLMLIVVDEPLFEFFLLSLNQRVFIFKFKLSLHGDGVNLVVNFLADNVVDGIPLLELQQRWLIVFIFFVLVLLAESDTFFALLNEVVFKLVVERTQSLFVVSKLGLSLEFEVRQQVQHFLDAH